MAHRHVFKPDPTAPVDHPAVRAWSRLGRDPILPVSIETLRWRRNPSPRFGVYRLHGVGDQGQAVVAKCAPMERIRVERVVYEEILPQVPVPSLRYYGLVEDPSAGVGWLFLEDLGERRYSKSNPTHRALAARWLGVFHSTTSRVGFSGRLPPVDLSRYLSFLASARHRIDEGLREPTLGVDEVAVLEATARSLGRVEAGWTAIERFCGGAPECVVHSDFFSKNVRIRAEGSSWTIRVFDWSRARWGVPAEDISGLDLVSYHEVVRDAWPSLDSGRLAQLEQIGMVFRYVAWIRSTLRWVGGTRGGNAIPHLASYEPLLAEAWRRWNDGR